MFNFSGKSARCVKKAPTEIDFFTFWKTLDDTYFVHLTSSSLEYKCKEILVKPFYASQTKDANNSQMAAGLREEVAKIGLTTYTDYFFHKKMLSPPLDSNGTQFGKRDIGRETNSNLLLGYYVFPITETATKSTNLSKKLSFEQKTLTQHLQVRESLNRSLLKTLQKRIASDDFKSLIDLRDSTKDAQILFLKSEIVKLECKQLAESIVSISYDPSNTEYQLKFDPALNVPPMCLSQEGVKLMSRYQQGIFNVSPYDAAIASAMKVSYADAKKKGRKYLKEAEVPPIKQIRNLFDEEIMGREIDFSLYGFCHHCKEIKPKIGLVKCKRNCACGIMANPAPNLTAGSKRKKGQRSLMPQGVKHKKTMKDQKQPCERMFCFACINFNYDQNPTTVQLDPAWICPYCQKQCYCTRCLRNELISRFKTLYISLGRPSADLEGITGRVHAARSLGEIHGTPKMELKKLQKRLKALKKSKNILEVLRGEVIVAVEKEKLKREEMLEKFDMHDNTTDTVTPVESTRRGKKRKIKRYETCKL